MTIAAVAAFVTRVKFRRRRKGEEEGKNNVARRDSNITSAPRTARLIADIASYDNDSNVSFFSTINAVALKFTAVFLMYHIFLWSGHTRCTNLDIEEHELVLIDRLGLSGARIQGRRNNIRILYHLLHRNTLIPGTAYLHPEYTALLITRELIVTFENYVSVFTCRLLLVNSRGNARGRRHLVKNRLLHYGNRGADKSDICFTIGRSQTPSRTKTAKIQ